MQRDTIVGVGLVIAGIAELQWASAFFAQGDTPLALMLFVAGAGTVLAAVGAFFREARSWALWGGLAVAALGHVAYFFSTLGYDAILVAAAALAAVGLVLAAWGARAPGSALARVGLAVAAAGGLAWTVADMMAGSMTFMVGNIFATVGWALAALFTTPGP